MNTIRSSALRPTRQIDDENSERHADLRGRQADARRGIHRVDHVVDELLDVAGQLADVGRALVQRGLAELQNRANHPPSRSRRLDAASGCALNLACSRSVALA